MAEITAAMVKELRETSGAGMMDAKKALVENGGDMQAAQDWLRKKGLSTAAKKSSRTAAEGLVGLSTSGTSGAVVEINAETDFVARNDQFQNFVKTAADIALNKASDVDALAVADFGNGKSVKDTLTDLIATIGENMSIRRMTKLTVKDGVVCGYVHNALNPGLGKIGVLVALESTGDKTQLEAMGKQIAMHIAAAFPQYLDRSTVDASAIERERTVLRDQAKQQGKTDEVIEKMLEGRMRKFYEEIVLLDQIFVVDGETRISALLEKAGKDLGAPVAITGYARLQLGEGIEKETADFAAEVAAAVNG
ncbi:MAG: translation elongation factor Ts [Alphaproteobacteria bacterium]|nr:translation elongation factor Ts [Alphaproteobacteria bacterium]